MQEFQSGDFNLMREIATVKEDRSLVRDLDSSAILSRDTDGFRMRLEKKRSMEKLRSNDDRINSLEEKLTRIESLLEELLRGKNG